MAAMIDPPMKVKYVGNKPEKSDTVTGSGYVWKKGEAIIVPSSVGRKLVVPQFSFVWVEEKMKKDELGEGVQIPLGRVSSSKKLDEAYPINVEPRGVGAGSVGKK